MAEFKISEDAAREQMDVLYDYYEIDLDSLDGDVRSAVKQSEQKLVKAIRIGRLEIALNDDGVITVTQHVRGGEVLEYREIDGKAKVAMGSKEAGDHYGRAYALMGSLCGHGDAVIIKLKGPDLSTVECLGTVFLQA